VPTRAMAKSRVTTVSIQGNPNEEETHPAASQGCFAAAGASKAGAQALVISGGVANFTDVRTFQGTMLSPMRCGSNCGARVRAGICAARRAGLREGLAMMK